MATVKSSGQITINIHLQLSEQEAAALYNIVGYGHEAFLEVFYKHLGTHYLKPHEKGVISLFETIKNEIGGHLHSVEEARRLLKKYKL